MLTTLAAEIPASSHTPVSYSYFAGYALLKYTECNCLHVIADVFICTMHSVRNTNMFSYFENTLLSSAHFY